MSTITAAVMPTPRSKHAIATITRVSTLTPFFGGAIAPDDTGWPYRWLDPGAAMLGGRGFPIGAFGFIFTVRDWSMEGARPG